MNSKFRQRLVSSTLFLSASMLASAVVTPAAWAQDVTAGSLSGTIVDAAGNPVSGATVAATSPQGVTRSVTTGSDGTFQMPQLPVGLYDVRISVEGGPTVLNEDVQVSLGGANYTFTVGAEGASTGTSADGEEIVVMGTRQAEIDFAGTATGVVFDVQEVAERVPVPRTIEAIQLLAPQATSGDVAFGNTVSLGGSSVAENIYYINGMNITNFRTFVGGTTVPFEFYDQVQVKTGGYQAEFGRNTGGAVIALTRSGSNEFRGGMNVHWIPNSLRSEAPNTYIARNELDRRQSVEANVWASGPIIPDRAFFFGFFNPRYFSFTDTAQNCVGGAGGTCTDASLTRQVFDDPFYGGKIDLNLFRGHRLEATYFNDKQDNEVDTDGSGTTHFSGGENMILRYTGAFTDWLTLSGLYGKSKYNQTSAGAEDAIPYVIDGRSGTLQYIAGNPAGLIETGEDQRINYRVDADILFNALGSHHIRAGWDLEKLNAENVSQYSGGSYFRFYRAGGNGALAGAIPANTDYIRVRTYFSGGAFDSENTAMYIQDSWDVTDRLNLNIGIRNDRFRNFNAAGDEFVDLQNQWAPRLGVNFDPFGDKRSRISAFYGRYYLPIAANTNIRLAGNEEFIETFYRLQGVGAGQQYTGSLTAPPLGVQVAQNILSAGGVAPATTVRSKNLQPQYLDEFIIGGEHRFANSRWTASVNLIHRRLGAVLEDADFDYVVPTFCKTQTLSFCNPTTTPALGSGGYVLINPGSDLVVDVDTATGLQELTIPASAIDLPKARRHYTAAEFKFDRGWDGVWGVSGSYVWARSRGNYEGGVKSDIGQDDTGLTQDFDEPGWMDGANGFLPNHREHTFKLYGAYQVFPAFRVGFNALLQSPRKFGCIGTYPYTDPKDPLFGRAVTTLASSWYCRAQVEAGNVQERQGGRKWLVGRGDVFESDWHKRIDLSFAYTVPTQGLRGFTLRADVFNVLNFKSKLDFNEFGDLDDPLSINPNYQRPTAYQTPRYVRFSASVDF